MEKEEKNWIIMRTNQETKNDEIFVYVKEEKTAEFLKLKMNQYEKLLESKYTYEVSKSYDKNDKINAQIKEGKDGKNANLLMKAFVEERMKEIKKKEEGKEQESNGLNRK